MERVIFLDIDGVLITRQSISQFKSARVFDPVCVANFNRLIKELSPAIVVSSTWRMGRSVPDLQKLLDSQNVQNARVIGKTPNIMDERGQEIKKWLSENEGITKFAILDDEISDMGDMLPFVIKTSMIGGLQDHHVDAVINFFGGK